MTEIIEILNSLIASLKDKTVCLEWKKKYIEYFDTFILDCDGVLYRCHEPIAGAKEVLTKLIAMKKRIIFLSNSSTKTHKMFIDKFKIMFDIKVKANQVFTSGIATAAYLTSIFSELKQYTQHIKILFIGSQGLYNLLKDEINTRNISNVSILWTRNDIPHLDDMNISQLSTIKLDPDVRIIVVGFDHFYSYMDISLVCRYLHEQKHKMYLIGTNDDVTFPAKVGVLLPGTGALLAAIEALSPIAIQTCGKPHKLLFDIIKQKHTEINENKCIMIGDRIDTDIVFGRNAGIKTALVMTGIATKEQLKMSPIKPTFVLPSIENIL